MEAEISIVLIIITYFSKIILGILGLMYAKNPVRKVFFIPIGLGVLSAMFVVFFYANFEWLREYGSFFLRTAQLLNEWSYVLFLVFGFAALKVNIFTETRDRVYNVVKRVSDKWIRRQSP